jgi:antitoxin YefM
MATSITYSEARASLASLWDRVVSEREAVVITRRGKEDVALLPAEELGALMETAYLLRSPANAERLLKGLEQARAGEGALSSVEELRKEVGLG